MISVSICPACNNDTWTEHLTCVDHTVSHETFTLKKCGNCSLLTTSPRPDNTTLTDYYQSEDYISHTSRANSFIDKIYLLARSYTLRWKLRLIKKYSGAPSYILDYGCGTGDFLKACQQNNWKTTGIEPSPAARRLALSKTNADIHSNTTELPGRKFNTITLWHVLEHVPDLHELIQQLVSLMETNGTLFIAVPNYKSFDGEHYKEYWAGYDVPRHLWHFTSENMSVLLAQHSLKVIDIIPMKLDSFYVSMLSEKYSNNGSNTVRSITKAIITGLKSNLKAKKTGNYSSLIYIAKKE